MKLVSDISADMLLRTVDELTNNGIPNSLDLNIETIKNLCKPWKIRKLEVMAEQKIKEYYLLKKLKC